VILLKKVKAKGGKEFYRRKKKEWEVKKCNLIVKKE